MSYSHVPCETRYLDMLVANFANGLILSYDYALNDT